MGRYAQCTDENCDACFPSDMCRVCKGRVNDNGACVDCPSETALPNNSIVACDERLVLKKSLESPLVPLCVVHGRDGREVL